MSLAGFLGDGYDIAILAQLNVDVVMARLLVSNSGSSADPKRWREPESVEVVGKTDDKQMGS